LLLLGGSLPDRVGVAPETISPPHINKRGIDYLSFMVINLFKLSIADVFFSRIFSKRNIK